MTIQYPVVTPKISCVYDDLLKKGCEVEKELERTQEELKEGESGGRHDTHRVLIYEILKNNDDINVKAYKTKIYKTV